MRAGAAEGASWPILKISTSAHASRRGKCPQTDAEGEAGVEHLRNPEPDSAISSIRWTTSRMRSSLRKMPPMRCSHWGLGFQMILAQLKDVLTNNNVVLIESKGKPFDHNVHEAVETVETNDYPPGTIVEEFIKGYKRG